MWEGFKLYIRKKIHIEQEIGLIKDKLLDFERAWGNFKNIFWEARKKAKVNCRRQRLSLSLSLSLSLFVSHKAFYLIVTCCRKLEMFLFLLFLHCHSFSFLPYPSLLSPLLSLFSLSLEDDTKWPTRVDVSLNPNTIKMLSKVIFNTK